MSTDGAPWCCTERLYIHSTTSVCAKTVIRCTIRNSGNQEALMRSHTSGPRVYFIFVHKHEPLQVSCHYHSPSVTFAHADLQPGTGASGLEGGDVVIRISSVSDPSTPLTMDHWSLTGTHGFQFSSSIPELRRLLRRVFSTLRLARRTNSTWLMITVV